MWCWGQPGENVCADQWPSDFSGQHRYHNNIGVRLAETALNGGSLGVGSRRGVSPSGPVTRRWPLGFHNGSQSLPHFSKHPKPKSGILKTQPSGFPTRRWKHRSLSSERCIQSAAHSPIFVRVIESNLYGRHLSCWQTHPSANSDTSSHRATACCGTIRNACEVSEL